MRRLLPLIIAVGLSAIVGWASYGIGYRTGQRSVYPALDRTVLRELIRDIEIIRTRLGRAPGDQAELESMLGHPLPCFHDNGWGGLPTPVHYLRLDTDRYQLQYELMATDDWIYDSAKPEAGWLQRWY